MGSEHRPGRPGETGSLGDEKRRDSSDPHATHSSGASGATGKTASVPAFQASDIVADRYRIVRFIARGGMGEVFEAEDLELGGRVALKTVHLEATEREAALKRFKREIHLARKVTHPNVCRIFDLGRHPLPDGKGS